MNKLIPTLLFAILVAVSYHASAATITYTLDNIVQDDSNRLTGSFDWTYTETFAGGSGVFTSLWIEGDTGTPVPFNELTIDIQPKSIEITFAGEVHNNGIDIKLVFGGNGFTEQGGLILLEPEVQFGPYSKWSLQGGGNSGLYDSGGIASTVVPIPAAIWLFGAGLTFLLAVARRKS